MTDYWVTKYYLWKSGAYFQHDTLFGNLAEGWRHWDPLVGNFWTTALLSMSAGKDLYSSSCRPAEYMPWMSPGYASSTCL